MARRILQFPVPAYVVVLVFSLLIIGVTLLFHIFREYVYNYQVVLPDGQLAARQLTFGTWPALQNINFFTQVKDSFIDQGGMFIEADLSDMRLRVFDKGQVIKEVPILTKGKEGSWWETPAGLYEVDSKVKNHFSNFAQVHLPWSLPFQGNFFIHGWPYYPDGTPVESRYSGGCIRLSTEDAEQIFNLVHVGVPVLVYEKDFQSDDFSYVRKGPQITASHFLAADLRSGYVLTESQSTAEVPIASITKLMTALVAVEHVNIEKEILVQPGMVATTSIPRLKEGDRFSLLNLLYPLLMESSNEAANAIAGFLGQKYFVGLMNEKAKAIGMLHTKFVDPSGAGAGNVSTAQDLFALAKYLINNRSFVLKITRGEVDTRTYGPVAFKDLVNLNGFEGDKAFLGGKVGLTTAAGETIMSLFEVPSRDGNRTVVIVVLGSSDRVSDVQKIRDWIALEY